MERWSRPLAGKPADRGALTGLPGAVRFARDLVNLLTSLTLTSADRKLVQMNDCKGLPRTKGSLSNHRDCPVARATPRSQSPVLSATWLAPFLADLGCWSLAQAASEGWILPREVV